MANLHGDRSKTVVINTNQMNWQASPSPGVWRKRLELVGDNEKGMVTSVVRFDPGAGFPMHDHPLGEEVLVLDGVFADEFGRYPKGSFTLLPTGSRHAPKTDEGALLFVKLCQYPGEERPTRRVDTKDEAGWREIKPGLERFYVFDEAGYPEKIWLTRMAPGTKADDHVHEGGEEVFVIEGELRDGGGRYPAGTWMRFADGSRHQPFSDTGCTLYVKTGHLKVAA
ncbi:MAG: cupin domain-containing protein [Minwuia sp.]|uniref:cupin domain-containing protein n=1 Tax=Minwuia sp. TaxID=2493630 RepID=UPI003A841D5C